jgi:hypothetical protein
MLRFVLYRTFVRILTLYIKSAHNANPQLALIPTSEEEGLRALVWSMAHRDIRREINQLGRRSHC